MMTVAKTLKYERLKRGMTQQEFSEFLGIERSAFSRYETGKNISPNAIKLMSDKLQIDLALIFIKEEY